MQQAIDVRTMVWFNPGLISAYYMVPAMIGIILQYSPRCLRPPPSSASAKGAPSNS